MTASPAPLVSVVVPVYGNADTIDPLHGRIAAALDTWPGGFEIVFVNDASPDRSRAVLDALSARDSRVSVRHLARNIGQHRAILTGFAAASGGYVISIDADLQDPPEAIRQLVGRLDDGFDVAFAGRHGRYHGSWARQVTSQVFKSAQSRLTGLPSDAGAYVALKRPVVDRLLRMPAGAQTVVAMIGFTGGRMTSVPIERAPRPIGRSAFSSVQRLTLALHTLVWAARMRFAGRRVGS